jgi:hypothetical protein
MDIQNKQSVRTILLFILVCWLCSGARAADLRLVADRSVVPVGGEFRVAVVTGSVSEVLGTDLSLSVSPDHASVLDILVGRMGEFQWIRKSFETQRHIGVTGFMMDASWGTLDWSADDTLAVFVMERQDAAAFSVGLRGESPILLDGNRSVIPCEVQPLELAVVTHTDQVHERTRDKTLSVSIYPNPFNASVCFRIHQDARQGPGVITVFDLRGRALWQMNWLSPEGDCRLVWDGRDRNGRLLPSGVYCYRVQVHDLTMDGKCVIVR